MSEQSVSSYRVSLADGSKIPAPLALPEQLCPDEAWLLNNDRSHQSPIDKLYEAAWANLETAHCTRPGKRVAKLARAAIIFKTLEEQNSRYKFAAGLVLDYLPVYEFRVQNEPYPSDTLPSLYRRLGNRAFRLTAATTLAAVMRNKGNLGTIYETFFLALSASTFDPWYLAFPASVREEAASSKAENYNHDAYVIRDQKIPLQIKGTVSTDQRKYQPQVFKLRMRNLLFSSAVNAYGLERWSARRQSAVNRKYVMPPDKMHKLFQLTGRSLAADAEGRALNEQEAAFVALLKNNTIAQIDRISSLQTNAEIVGVDAPPNENDASR